MIGLREEFKLLLAPWEHHNEKKKITAEQCRQLNLMALEICGTLGASTGTMSSVEIDAQTMNHGAQGTKR